MLRGKVKPFAAKEHERIPTLVTISKEQSAQPNKVVLQPK
jgi:hypothetical protein